MSEESTESQLGRITVTPSWGRRLAGIEGLRGVAALTVLLGHIKLINPAVHLGVLKLPLALMGHGLTLFFALSGFLLFRPFAASIIESTPLPQISSFAVNRVLRIYPAYITILLISALVLGTANYAPLSTSGATVRGDRVGHLTDPRILGLDVTMLQTLVPGGVQTGLGVAWSLTVELIFYIVMPALALLAAHGFTSHGGHRRWWRATAPALLLLLVGVATKILSRPLYDHLSADDLNIAQWGGTWTAVLARSFLMHADLFAFGMLAAVALEWLKVTEAPLDRLRQLRRVTWCLALVAALAGVPDTSVSDTLFAFSFGAVIFLVAAPDRHGGTGRLARALEFPVLRYTGLVSYSMYLWHVSVIWLLVNAGATFSGSGPATYGLNAVTVLAVTLALSSATYFAVERPALRLKAPLLRQLSSRKEPST